VVELCGRLPLVLAIAGSIPVVKGKGLTADAWKQLTKDLENVAKEMRLSEEQSTSLSVVLETSFVALATRRQEELLKTAVLAAGAVAPIEMLRNLWQTEDTEGARDEAECLVSKCLLQDMGGGGHRVHDLVLEFVASKIKAEVEVVEEAITLQAQYLARADVVEGYRNSEHGASDQGLFFLDALWRSVEKLSGDSELEVHSYRTSLRESELFKATIHTAKFYSSVVHLLEIQGKYAEAEALYERCQAINEKVLGREHPSFATMLHNRAVLLASQGKYAEAEAMYERSQAIKEKALGGEHPSLAATLNNRAVLLQEQGKYAEVEALYERSQAINEKALGPEHPSFATTLRSRAGLLARQGKYAEAEALYERCQAIFEKVLGPEH
ncbi:unnamed protein product, partial [Pylaiella littoralis]